MDEPIELDPIGRDEIREEDDKRDDGKISQIEAKLEELRHFNLRLETSSHEDFGNIMLGEK